MEYTIVGKIVNSHGVKGEVKVYPLTTNIERFDQIKFLYIGDKKTKIQLQNSRYHKNMAILKFKEFDNINEILDYKDEYVYVDEDEKIVLPKDNFFIYELLQCEVYNQEMEFVGTITDVIQSHSNDVYVVKNPDLNKEYLIPAVKEFIYDVDISKKRIIITPIEGMIE